MGNTPVVAKQDIAKYVQDMAEIEAAEFTMRKAVAEMRREAEAIRRKNQDEVAQKEDFLKRSEACQAAEKQDFESRQELTPPTPPPPPPDPPKEPACWKEYQSKNLHEKELTKPTHNNRPEIGPFIVLGIFAVPCIGSFLGALFPYFVFGTSEPGVISIIGGNIVILILYIFVCSLICSSITNHRYSKAIAEYNHDFPIKEIGDEYYEKKKQYDQMYQEHQLLTEKYEKLRKQYNTLNEEKRKQGEKIITRNNTIIRAKEDITRALKQQEKDEIRLQYIFAQADLLLRTADELHAKKESLYRANIIPPDYRELDCVLMFHQIFRNDLADTMREAVKLYEERVFRQEVIRGIDRIYSMLGRLASSMSSIENRLVQIRDEVKLMGNDVYQMSQSFANSQSAILSSIKQGQRETARYQDMSRSEQQRFQEQMLTETRASTYATEALKNATDKLVWYEQQKYWKNM